MEKLDGFVDRENKGLVKKNWADLRENNDIDVKHSNCLILKYTYYTLFLC